MGVLEIGQRVTVMLNRKHGLEGEKRAIAATFLGYHTADKEWADVELGEDHAGSDLRADQKRRRHLSVPVSVIRTVLLLLLMIWFQNPSEAQHLGDVQLSTVYQLLTPTPSTCTGSAQTFTVQNLGQISHQASAVSSNASSLTMEIDGLDATGAVYRLSNPQISFVNGTTTSYVAQGYGYYPGFRVSVTCTAAASFSLSYSGGATAFSQVVGPGGGTPVPVTGGLAANVQGVVAQQQNGAQVFPVLTGGLQNPINASFTTVGIDNFTSSIGAGFCSTGSACQSTTVSSPPPAKSGELAVAFESTVGSSGGAANPSCPASASSCVLPPWTAVPTTTCAGNSPEGCAATLSNPASGQPLIQAIGQSTVNGFNVGAIVLTTATAVRQGTTAGAAAVTFASNTLAGSTLIAALGCATTSTCTVSSVADSQGLTWKQILNQPGNGTNQQSGISVWAATTVSLAAADTITFTLGTGSAQNATAVELTGATPAALTAGAITLQADPTGALLTREDAQFPNQFVCNVPISTATTTLCESAPTTINGVAVRAYVTDVQYNTTTAGAGSLLQLVDGTGTNCGTGTANLSAITYSGAAVGLQNTLGMRTPLIAPPQSEVCVKQTGATPSTTTVEIHGFFAP